MRRVETGGLHPRGKGLPLNLIATGWRRMKSPPVAMAAGTAASRATGLLRTMALAWAVGVTAVSDAYNTANTAPMMIFTLVAGGALSAAVVPLLTRADNRREAASVLLGATALFAVAATAVVVAGAPLIVRVLTLGARDRQGYDAYAGLTVTWLRMFAPQVGLYAISVLAVAIMTARHRLALGAAAPVATNILTIAAAAAYVAAVDSRLLSPADVTALPRQLLGWGTTAAVATMAAIQLWGAFRTEVGLRVSVRLRHPAVKQVVRLGGWVLVYVIVNQIGLAAVIAIANAVEGGITAYQWGFMVMQLPYAIVAVSLLSAALPDIAAAADGTGARLAVARPARTTLLWLAPAAVGLLTLARPLATVVVGSAGAPLVAAAITGFSISLIPFSLFQLFTRTSYAREDARSPALVNIAVNVVNVLGAVAVVTAASSPRTRIIGLAAAHGASYGAGCVLLGRRLARRGTLDLRDLADHIAKILPATLLVGGGLALTIPWSRDLATRPSAAAGAAIAAGVAAGVYFLLVRRLALPLTTPRDADRPPGPPPHPGSP